MAEWSSYALEDFLLFSPRVYWRMFVLHNEAVWPMHVPALLAGGLLVWWTARPRPWSGRAAAAVLAMVWAWVGWSFLWERYATINWAATWVAAAFAAQSVLFLAFAGPAGTRGLTAGPAPRLAGWALLLYALFLHPFTGMVAGHPAGAAELFGIAPDPTAIATLGLVLLLRTGPAAWTAMAIPLAWCIVSAATLHTLGGPEWTAPAASVVVAVTAYLWPARWRSGGRA